MDSSLSEVSRWIGSLPLWSLDSYLLFIRTWRDLSHMAPAGSQHPAAVPHHRCHVFCPTAPSTPPVGVRSGRIPFPPLGLHCCRVTRSARSASKKKKRLTVFVDPEAVHACSGVRMSRTRSRGRTLAVAQLHRMVGSRGSIVGPQHAGFMAVRTGTFRFAFNQAGRETSFYKPLCPRHICKHAWSGICHYDSSHESARPGHRL